MKFMNKLFILIIILLSTIHIATAQTKSITASIGKILKDRKADVGVAVYLFSNGDTISINGDRHFPLQSVFKFHIALTVLNEVDKGCLSLKQKINITKADLLSNTWSPIRDKYPDGEMALTIAELIEYTVAQSDNNGCDILLKLIGGTKAVEEYLFEIGAKDVQIKANEEQMHAMWNVQFQNWTTPKSAVQLLSKFYSGQLLSKESSEILFKIMANTTTGANRIKGGVPHSTVVAHKTGTSDTNSQGITAAVNDIGIVILPDGSVYAMAVFVSNTRENNLINESIIAEISHTVWQYLLENNNSLPLK